MAISFADIAATRHLIGSDIVRTPTFHAPRLSTVTGAEIYVKYENLQVTNSFKERGALAKLLSLSPAERRAGVVTMSAGNHAQAVAYHSARLSVAATVVMPTTTPFVKIKATERFGAEIILAGETIAEAQGRALTIAQERNMTFVHPYDDPRVIAGQGTVVLEMLDDVPYIEILLIPVGGGGLIAGAAVAAREIKSTMETIGVQTALYPAMWNAINGDNKPIGGLTLAEGIAVRNVGHLTLPICRNLVSRFMLVDETDLERAIYYYLTIQKTMVEGAGAAGLAAILAEPNRFKGRKVGLILSGGNIDPRLLATITMRGLEREDRLASFCLTVPNSPGILGQIATRLGRLGADIVEVEHKQLFPGNPARGTSLRITIETRDNAHVEAIRTALETDGYHPSRIEATAGVLS